MSLERIVDIVSRAPSVELALNQSTVSTEFSVPHGFDSTLLAALLRRRLSNGDPASLFVIAATSRESEEICSALSAYLPDAEVLELPAWETLPHERLSPSAETVGRRLHAIRRMSIWEHSARANPFVVVASVRAALQPLVSGLNDVSNLELRTGSGGHQLEKIAAELISLAYSRVDLVARRGEFAVRGGILDVFPPTADRPYRFEFFGDTLDEIRPFSVADQRSSSEVIDAVTLTASRELLLTAAVCQRAREMVDEFPSLSSMLAKLAEGIAVEGMESLAPLLHDELLSIVDYLPAGTAIAIIEPERVATRAANLAETNREFLQAAWSAATVGATAPIDLGRGDFFTLDDLRISRGGSSGRELPVEGPGNSKQHGPWWGFTAFARADTEDVVGVNLSGVVVPARTIPSFLGNVDGSVEFVAERLRDGWNVVITAAGHGLVERAGDVLAAAGLAVSVFNAERLPASSSSGLVATRDPAGTGGESFEFGVVYIVQADIAAGFELPEARLAVLAEAEFYGRAAGHENRPVRKLASRRKVVVDPLQLAKGDYVVHQTHGIGRFVEMVKREIATGARPTGPSRSAGIPAVPKVIREFIVLEYAPSKRGQVGDRLFVPSDQLDLLSKYVGGESPTLSKLGGSDWAQAKGKARNAVRDIAVELVKLYSARMSSKGHAFGPDTPWQRELEESFAFVETADQLQTIDEVKADMEKPIPMDRLLAGDVGFGKTEVAVRAAFKAIQDGKQVAMLVPTTLLVKQHVETFAGRFAGFPVHIRALSRFQSDKESRETIEGMTAGTIDMVIGTHRLLSEGVVFKDLGLLIVDEEQRFGVEHKDALKKLKTNVDILSMSATPIPRTLEMAITGIREMSTLATPPEDRHPILTYVGPYSAPQVGAAIRRELLREGQVFFVHNRVSSINRVAAEISELVPEARIAVAHGQLAETALEQIVVDFWERRYDVLVCTTIIETGLDISNANTIIIDRADKYGLSQLHQLRGRVGRGRERAYAYLFYDPDKPLTELAHDRLATIAANNELGSGTQVALKDLEIRGAGNMLGAEQAGHIAGVGFDLYLRMIGEAVSTFRGDEQDGPSELRLELPVDARIPEEYVDSERLRLEAYQKLSGSSAASATEGAIDLVLDEITDRYGQPPAPVLGLVLVAKLRRVAHLAGLSEVVAVAGKLRVGPATIPDSRRVRMQRLYPSAKLVTANDVILVELPADLGDAALIDWVGKFISAIFLPDAAI